MFQSTESTTNRLIFSCEVFSSSQNSILYFSFVENFVDEEESKDWKETVPIERQFKCVSLKKKKKNTRGATCKFADRSKSLFREAYVPLERGSGAIISRSGIPRFPNVVNRQRERNSRTTPMIRVIRTIARGEKNFYQPIAVFYVPFIILVRCQQKYLSSFDSTERSSSIILVSSQNI